MKRLVITVPDGRTLYFRCNACDGITPANGHHEYRWNTSSKGTVAVCFLCNKTMTTHKDPSVLSYLHRLAREDFAKHEMKITKSFKYKAPLLKLEEK